MEEVRQHRTEDDAWLVYNGKVQCFAKPPFTGQFDRLSDHYCDRLVGAPITSQSTALPRLVSQHPLQGKGKEIGLAMEPCLKL